MKKIELFPLTAQALCPATEFDYYSRVNTHRGNVMIIMSAIAEELIRRAQEHDRDLSGTAAVARAVQGKEKTSPREHIRASRHHLDKQVPEDVNLIDVIEHVVNGIARLYEDGSPVERICYNVLEDAFRNTVCMLIDKARRTERRTNNAK